MPDFSWMNEFEKAQWRFINNEYPATSEGDRQKLQDVMRIFPDQKEEWSHLVAGMLK